MRSPTVFCHSRIWLIRRAHSLCMSVSDRLVGRSWPGRDWSSMSAWIVSCVAAYASRIWPMSRSRGRSCRISSRRAWEASARDGISDSGTAVGGVVSVAGVATSALGATAFWAVTGTVSVSSRIARHSREWRIRLSEG